MRAHCGPYDAKGTREESVKNLSPGRGSLGKRVSGHPLHRNLTAYSVQLRRELGDRPNGGGVPINSPEGTGKCGKLPPPAPADLCRHKAHPRTGSHPRETINICWHALSLWWFNQLDGRGPYDLYTNLQQHVEALRYIAQTGKPVEANVSHHFAFRGADDVTYIVSAYLAAKLAKSLGIRTYILQNMLNTPRWTWGVQDLAKSRAMLTLLRELEAPPSA